MTNRMTTGLTLCCLGLAACVAATPDGNSAHGDRQGIKADGASEPQSTLLTALTNYIQAACAQDTGEGISLTPDEATDLAQDLLAQSAVSRTFLADRGYRCSDGLRRLAEMAPDLAPEDLVADDQQYDVHSEDTHRAFALVVPGNAPILTVTNPGAEAFYLDGDETACTTGDRAQARQCVKVARVDAETGVMLDATHKAKQILSMYVAVGCERNVYLWEDATLSLERAGEIADCLLPGADNGIDCDEGSYICSEPTLELANMLSDALREAQYDTSTFIIEDEGTQAFGSIDGLPQHVVALPGLNAHWFTHGAATAYFLCEGPTTCSGEGCICID